MTAWGRVPQHPGGYSSAELGNHAMPSGFPFFFFCLKNITVLVKVGNVDQKKKVTHLKAVAQGNRYDIT
jgi:hypothetical protein